MQKISSNEVIMRESKKLPTLIIDARAEEECYAFEVIDPRNLPFVALNGTVYGGKRMLLHEVKLVLPKLKTWSFQYPNTLIAVSCTRFITHCPRIAEICSLLENEGINARGIDPHLYDFFNARRQQKLNKVLI